MAKCQEHFRRYNTLHITYTLFVHFLSPSLLFLLPWLSPNFKVIKEIANLEIFITICTAYVNVAISESFIFPSCCHDLWYHLLCREFKESALAAVWACVSDYHWWSPCVCGQTLLWGTLPVLPSWLCQECASVQPHAAATEELGVQGRWWLRVVS